MKEEQIHTIHNIEVCELLDEEWGISLTGEPNPKPEDYVKCYSKEQAFRIKENFDCNK